MNTDNKAKNLPVAKKQRKSPPGVRNSRFQAVLAAFRYCLNQLMATRSTNTTDNIISIMMAFRE